jgi:transposase
LLQRHSSSKRKTDKDDALRLVQLHMLSQLPTVTLPTTKVRQWRSLIAGRQTWVGRRIAVQNRIRALFVAQGLPAPRGARAWSTTGLAGIATIRPDSKAKTSETRNSCCAMLLAADYSKSPHRSIKFAA